MWKRRESQRIFHNVPGPTPWYPMPQMTGFEWKEAGKKEPAVGKTALKDSEGRVRAIFDFYNYVSKVDGNRLLVWHQRSTDRELGLTAPVNIKVIEPGKLEPLGSDASGLCRHMDESGIPLYFNGETVAEVNIPTTRADEQLVLAFPEPVNQLEELLILCRSSGITSDEGRESFNLGLLVAKPKRSTIRIYPQEWFNGGDFDYGYEWVTRVSRDDETGKVFGEGTRISPFVLDDSLKNMERWL